MANKQHFEMLEQGVLIWNSWRRAHPEIFPDLTEIYLPGTFLQSADLHDAYLSKADLRDAHLSKVDLTNADLRNTHLSKTDLRDARLINAILQGTDLTLADLRNTDLHDANLRNANLTGADLSSANLSGADLRNVDFSNARLIGTDLSEAILDGAKFNGANFREPTFIVRALATFISWIHIWAMRSFMENRGEANAPVFELNSNYSEGSVAGVISSAQHVPNPATYRRIVYELFDEQYTSEVEPDTHIRILTSDHPLVCQRVKLAAMQLHTDVYIKNGIISERDVNPDGLYVDEYSTRAKYYLVRNGQKVAAARQISCSKKEGILSLPTARNFSINPDILAEVAGVSGVASIKPGEVVEISALVSEKLERGTATNFDAVIALYSSMLRTSLESGHKLWIMNVEPTFIRRLQFMVGPGQVHVLGEARAYQGVPTIPVAVNPQAVVRKVLTSNQPHSDVYKAHMRTVLAGISDRKIPRDIRDLLAVSDIPVNEFPAIARLLTNPQTIAQAAVMAYSAARAFPAGGIKEFDGQVWTLWGIDVATSMPYVYGLTKMYTAQTLGGKAVGAALAIPSFLAPYIYFYAESGKNYPAYVNGIVAAFIGSALLKEVIGRTMRAKKEVKIREGFVRLPVSGMH